MADIATEETFDAPVRRRNPILVVLFGLVLVIFLALGGVVAIGSLAPQTEVAAVASEPMAIAEVLPAAADDALEPAGVDLGLADPALGAEDGAEASGFLGGLWGSVFGGGDEEEMAELDEAAPALDETGSVRSTIISRGVATPHSTSVCRMDGGVRRCSIAPPSP